MGGGKRMLGDGEGRQRKADRRWGKAMEGWKTVREGNGRLEDSEGRQWKVGRRWGKAKEG